jgi:hypothetical protein
MGAIEDTRKVIQDLIAPDLKAIDARLNSFDRKIDLTRDLLVAQMKTLETIMVTNHASLTHALDIDRRLERIENDRALKSA